MIRSADTGLPNVEESRKHKVVERSSSLRSLTRFLAAVLLFAIPAFPAIEGTVTNGTTNKPAAGDEIALIEFSQGMTEAAHAKADASGHFKFDVSNDGGMPHLVRATHQGVNYFKMVPPGTNSATFQVYDTTRKVEGLAYNVETAFQTDAGVLQVVHFFVVRNTSSPPRTQSAESGFEVALPENAKLEQSDVQSPGGQPIQTSPNPNGKGRYVFEYPLRPGETTFRIMYTLPYSGNLDFKPTLLYPANQYAVITPQSMSFEAKNKGVYLSQPHQGGVNVQIANNVTPGTDLSYRISGNGQMPDTSAQQGDQGGMGGDQAGMTSNGGPRPGGGLGAPINTPDPLSRYKLPIALGLGLIFVFGAFYIVTQRAKAQAIESSAESETESLDEQPIPSAKPARDRSALLLEAMKEELFQLEVDRQRGRLTSEEYTTAKAALDATLQRALKRSESSAREAGA